MLHSLSLALLDLFVGALDPPLYLCVNQYPQGQIITFLQILVFALCIYSGKNINSGHYFTVIHKSQPLRRAWWLLLFSLSGNTIWVAPLPAGEYDDDAWSLEQSWVG